jgi:tetratricopeptide (TPR) repeat protein
MNCHDFDTAKEKWQNIYCISEREIERGDQYDPSLDVFYYARCWSRYWIAACLQRQGLLADAQRFAHASLHDSINCRYPEGIFSSQSRLASIYLEQGQLEDAKNLLIASIELAQNYQGRRFIALNHRLYSRLHTLRGDLSAAHAALTEALDLFERLGMRHDLAEAREELTRLEARMAAAAE